MRRLTVLAGLVALMVGSIAPADAATPGALTPAQASANCEAFFGVSAGPEPLSACQWDMRRIEAGADSYANATGAGVTVGVIDGGVDLTHPDLAGNLDVARSCSFIFDDTPTAAPQEIANGDCSNKTAVQDLQGHGTHVATTIAGALNGEGIAGVAPDATIVALKACTVVGFCFVDSVAAALRYAGDERLDVVNLSLFADPYLYYCKNDAGQRAMLTEMRRAARYAQQRGVVIVAAAGNEAQDLGHPEFDDISPDWPPNTAEVRRVRNNCQVAPAELPGVVTVSASGVTQLAGYSNVGGPTIDVTAPGGDAVQTPGTTYRPDPGRLVEHRHHRQLGVPGSRGPRRRGRERRALGVDQRDVDGVAARRGRCGADPRAAPGLEPRRGRGRDPSERRAVRLPDRLAGERSTPVQGRSVEHDVLRRGDGERPGRELAVDRCDAGSARAGRRPALVASVEA